MCVGGGGGRDVRGTRGREVEGEGTGLCIVNMGTSYKRGVRAS